MNALVQVRQMGYLMSEDLHNQIMSGIDSLRLLEGLVSTSCSAPVTPCFDLEDLAGYLQLLLVHTYKPMKSLECQRWAPGGDEHREPPEEKAAPVKGEAELLRDYRAMPDDDRKHLRRCAEALAYVAGQKVRP